MDWGVLVVVCWCKTAAVWLCKVPRVKKSALKQASKVKLVKISSNPKQFWMHSFQPEEGLQNVRDCFVLQDVYSLSQPIVLRLLYINNSSLSGLFIPAREPGCVPF